MTMSVSSLQASAGATIAMADVDDWNGTLYCPLCGREIEKIGTPAIPVEIIDDTNLIAALDRDRVPVFGGSCKRHREDIRLAAPVPFAPESYQSARAQIEGKTRLIGIPNPLCKTANAAEDGCQAAGHQEGRQ